jgi:hypothetical protein
MISAAAHGLIGMQLHTYLNYGGNCEQAVPILRGAPRREGDDADAAW